VALYMAGRRAAEIAEGLIAQGVPADRPVVLVENATLPQQRVRATRLSGLAQAAAGLGDGPALLLVGEVYRALLDAQAGAGPRRAWGPASEADAPPAMPPHLTVRAAA
jgi:uroporphyrin-III C-methyltransferase